MVCVENRLGGSCMKLSSAFKYRNLWLGAAMVLVVLFHSGFAFSCAPLRALQDVGYCGVDICLFASGIGCSYSLEKDPSALRFLKRRVKRLGPVYYCFLLPWLGLKLLSGGFPLKAVLFNLLGIQSFVSWAHHFNWYISVLVMVYLLAPVFQRLANCRGGLWKDLAVTVCLMAVGIPFLDSVDILIMVSRLPVFYLGMVYARQAKQGAVIPAVGWALHLLAALAGICVFWVSFIRFPGFLYQGLYWYPFVLIVPGFCLLLSAAADFTEKHPPLRWISRGLSAIGTYSFELYLVHIFLFESVMPRLSDRLPGIPNNLLWLCSLPVIAAGCYILNKAARLVSRLFP